MQLSGLHGVRLGRTRVLRIRVVSFRVMSAQLSEGVVTGASGASVHLPKSGTGK
jgi:hypothetical protein